MRVLVVSEDGKERLRASSALALHGKIEVVEAASAQEARRLILVDREAFDVLIIDGDLTPRGGFAVLYDLRARADLDQLTAIPSIVLTSRDQDRWLADWAGANEVLRKPVSSFELAERVAALEGAEVVGYGDAAATDRQLASALTDD